MTITLRELQNHLQNYLLTGDLTIADFIVNPAKDERDARLAIYRDGYYICLLAILEKDFTLLKKLIGQQTFEEMGLRYIDAYPSHYFSIKDFGQRLPDFLRTVQPYAEQLHLAELADFLWELNNTLIAADAPVLTTADLMQIPPDAWDELQLKTHPSVKLMTQQWNTTALWQALQQDKPAPKPAHLNKPSYYLIWRKGLTPHYYEIPEEAAWIISALQANKTFSAVCEGLSEWMPEETVAPYLVDRLKNWLNEGIFSQVRY